MDRSLRGLGGAKLVDPIPTSPLTVLKHQIKHLGFNDLSHKVGVALASAGPTGWLEH